MATTALQPVAEQTSAIQRWSPEEQSIIRSVIAPGLSDIELRFFAQVCHATGLNPIMNQIHAIKRNAWNAETRQSEPKLTIQTSIHGLRLIADRTRRYAPGRRPEFAYKDGGALLSATAFVKKFAEGEWHEVSDTAYWEEYVQTNRDGTPIALWKSKPHVMLAKCAEALALRRAFPAEMAGVYTDDEMPEADPPPMSVTPADLAGKPAPAASAPPPAPINAVSEAQLKKLYATAREKNWSSDDVKGAMRDLWGVDSSKNLTKYQAGLLIDLIEDRLAISYDEHGKARLGKVGLDRPAAPIDGELIEDDDHPL